MISRIILENVWKFHEETAALKDFSYTFNRGKLYLVTGSNGSGKTTLLSVIGGLSRYQEGKLRFEMKEAGVSDPVSGTWNFFHATGPHALYRELTVIENMTLLVTGYFTTSCVNHETSGDISSAVLSALDRFRLRTVQDVKFSSLSRGYQQRVYLAGIFLCLNASEIPWVLLDEPAVFLDTEGMDCLQKALSELLDGGAGCIMATHEKEISSSLPSIPLRLDNGKLSGEV
jgi:ABC-type transport system involved in cytochrome c biogenesis ATPase subunit